MSLQIQPFVLDCPSRRGSPWPALKMTAKRYRPSGIPQVDGPTLLFFHCIGAHKEQWEPVIAYLFMQSQSSNLGHRGVREAWVFDWPTHGDAALINREALQQRPDSVSIYDWVPGVVQFLCSNFIHGHRIVLCGHSAGAGAAVHTTAEFYPNLASAGITSLILVEPTIIKRELFNEHFDDRISQMDFAISATSSRRDHWKSKQDALLYFKKRLPWSMWDPRIVRLYVEYGLCKLENGSVTLKCDKKREAEGFPDVDPHFEAVVCLNKLCHALPVHTIWGTRNDLIPDFIQDSLSDASDGRPMASVTKVKRSGHMIVQEQPIGLARAIYDILETIPSIATLRSKL